MKLIILIILTAIINVTLINKDFRFESSAIKMTTQVEQSTINNEMLSVLKRKDLLAKLKEQMLNQLKRYGEYIVNIIVKTHIISIENSNSTLNISSKPKAIKAEKI